MAPPELSITAEDRASLKSLTRSRTAPAGRLERARTVLAVADGAGTTGTADLVGVSRPTVIKWRDRSAEHGRAGLDDELRSGRPKTIDDAAMLAATLDPPPDTLGVTHWSTRLLATQLGIGDATVARAWRKYRIKPWRREATRRRSWDRQLPPVGHRVHVRGASTRSGVSHTAA